jgi:hypothetical protein
LDRFAFNPRWRIGIVKRELHLLEGRAPFGARLFSLRLADGLAEGQKSAQPGDDPSAGSRLVNFAARGTL